MIRANRLRIDTQVMVGGEVVTVSAITKKKIGYHKDGGNPCHLQYARLCEVEPIPVTVEMMEEWGWCHTEFEEMWNEDMDEKYDELMIEVVSPDGRVVVNNTSNRQEPYKWHVHVDNERYESTGSMDVAWLHELQGCLIDNDMELKTFCGETAEHH